MKFYLFCASSNKRKQNHHFLQVHQTIVTYHLLLLTDVEQQPHLHLALLHVVKVLRFHYQNLGCAQCCRWQQVFLKLFIGIQCKNFLQKKFEHHPNLYLLFARQLLLSVAFLNCLLESIDHYDRVESRDNQETLGCLEESKIGLSWMYLSIMS